MNKSLFVIWGNWVFQIIKNTKTKKIKLVSIFGPTFRSGTPPRCLCSTWGCWVLQQCSRCHPKALVQDLSLWRTAGRRTRKAHLISIIWFTSPENNYCGKQCWYISNTIHHGYLDLKTLEHLWLLTPNKSWWEKETNESVNSLYFSSEVWNEWPLQNIPEIDF